MQGKTILWLKSFMRLWRAFPRTSSQMSCWFLFPDCGVVLGFWFLVDLAPGDRKEVWGTSKIPLGAALDSSHSSQCQAGETTSPFLQILCQPASPAPPEPAWHTQGSTSSILSPLISPLWSFTLVVTIRSPSLVAGVYEGKSIHDVTVSQVFNFNPLWGAVVRVQAHRLLIYLQIRLSESGS